MKQDANSTQYREIECLKFLRFEGFEGSTYLVPTASLIRFARASTDSSFCLITVATKSRLIPSGMSSSKWPRSVEDKRHTTWKSRRLNE